MSCKNNRIMKMTTSKTMNVSVKAVYSHNVDLSCIFGTLQNVASESQRRTVFPETLHLRRKAIPPEKLQRKTIPPET